ncbi:Detected protein of unknown function [Hibiscus syriacus]|uniref:Integrase catalytic domain-containing protein n=1 Tax=Hibiscus syriacus TaxID=106335 RepID=A0A6A2YC73_HIBSY|nr:Detected protein of unknown function [Hibiscus syriacus]
MNVGVWMLIVFTVSKRPGKAHPVPRSPRLPHSVSLSLIDNNYNMLPTKGGLPLSDSNLTRSFMWVDDIEDIQAEAVTFYFGLFSSSSPPSPDGLLQTVTPVIDPRKAHGIDGLPSSFCWSLAIGLGRCLSSYQGGPRITHLLYANDSLLFLLIHDVEFHHVRVVLDLYESCSDQKMNFAKSSKYFSPITPLDVQAYLKSCLGVSYVSDSGHYLVYFKAVGQTLPTFVTGCYLLPDRVIDDMVFNIAMLGKNIWWCFTNPDSFVTRILATKYFPSGVSDGSCGLCGLSEETVLHALRDYPIVRSILHSTGLVIDEASLHCTTCGEWLEYLMQSLSLQRFTALLILWKICWSHCVLLDSRIIINVDGACPKRLGSSVVGVVAIDSTGSVIVGRVFSCSGVACIVEAQALCHGIRVAIEIEFTRVMMDNQTESHEARLNRTEEKTEDKAFHVKGKAFPKKNEQKWRGQVGSRGRGGRGRGRDRSDGYQNQTQQRDNKRQWVLNHMNCVKSLFNEIDEIFKQKVTLGDNKQIQVEGKGNVAVKSSYGKLMATGYSILFDDASCVIKDKKSDQTIVDIRMTPNKWFPLVISDVQNNALAIKETSESRLWHLTFKALVEKQTGRCIKALRTDRGGEFVLHEFNSFCEEHGMRRELTAPYTPEQNGVVERKNRTIVEIERSMLKAKELSNQLWAEAVATEVYLLNLSPTSVVLNQTPYEAWYEKRPLFETIRIILALAAHLKKTVYQFDVKSAFLNADLQEGVYIAQPDGFMIEGTYEFLIICLYVDDMIYMGSSSLINEFKACMIKEFEMTNLGALQFFLGLEVMQIEDGIFVSQKKYAVDLLKKLKMTGCKTVATPMNLNEKLNDDGTEATDARSFKSLVGGLIYLTNTRPDISFVVGVISRFMHCLSRHHFGAAKRVTVYCQNS